MNFCSKIIIFTVTICSFFGGMLFWALHYQWVDFSVLELYNPSKPSVLLDDEGNEWARFELDKREPIKLAHMPLHLIHAFLASEDREFFNHGGISWRGIIRSMYVNFRNRRIVQGASTITQQLVKLLFFDSRRTFNRKLKEQFLAFIVERQYTKDQILETYLNHIYFGCGIYGVAAASERFFGKFVQDISYGEAATLAAIVKSPAQYCPLLALDAAQKRRNLILRLMADLHYISKEDSQKAQQQSLQICAGRPSIAPHFKETLRIMLEGIVGKKELYAGGLKIQTTINTTLQKNAEQKFVEHVTKLQKELHPSVDGALIAMDPKTGEIKALVGGVDFKRSQFNRALQARRQMGSIFKPLIYAVAMEQGMNFAHIEIDEPITIELPTITWTPQNNTRTFEGPMTLARALSLSNNIVSIKTLMRIGIEPVIALAKKCRIQATLYPYPSLALGCVDITLLEAIGSFNIFANNGMYVEPHYVVWIKNQSGKKIWKTEPIKERVISSRASDQVAQVLGIGIQRFLKRIKKTSCTSEAIGKTGTTNESRTCWFSGATPELTTSIYIGCDDNRSLGKNIYAALTAFPIWLGLYENLSPQKTSFVYDPTLKEINIHWKSGEVVQQVNDHDIVSLLV